MPRYRYRLWTLLSLFALAGCLDHPRVVDPSLGGAGAAASSAANSLLIDGSPLERVNVAYTNTGGTAGALTLNVTEFVARGNGSLAARLEVTHVDGLVQSPPKPVTVGAAVRGVGAPQPPCKTAGALEITLAPGGHTEPGLGQLHPTSVMVHDPTWTGGDGIGRTICNITQLLATNASQAAIAAQLNNLLRQLQALDPWGLDELAAILSSDDPPAYARIGDFIEVRLLGKGTLDAREPEEPTSTTRGVGPDEPDEVERSLTLVPMHVFNTRTLNEFEIRVDASRLREIHAARAGLGLTRATEGVDDPSAVEGGRGGGAVLSVASVPTIGTFALSNGVDGRIIRTPTTRWPWRAISQFTYSDPDNSGCTGTLVGPRHLVTNAHCVVKQGTSSWKTITVAPGRNGTGDGSHPFGSSTIRPNPLPGTEAWYFTPAPWRVWNTPDPDQWDYAVIVIPDRLGAQTGWMGYAGLPGVQLNARTHYNRGYPKCGGTRPDVPADCQVARLYGDVARCATGNYTFMGDNGWNRAVDHTCDVSGGHSGSPLYHYAFDAVLGKNVPVVTAVHFRSLCDYDTTTVCGESDNRPSRARRFDPVAVDEISFFRQLFP